MSRIGAIVGRVASGLTVVGGLCVALMMLHVAAEIALRAAFNMPLPGTITIVSNYYMVVVAFAPLALLEQTDRHISVDIVAEVLPQTLRRVTGVLVRVLTVVVMALIAYRTGEEAISKTAIGAAITQGTSVIPVWPSYYALPIGAGAMAIVALLRLIELALGIRTGLPESLPELSEEGTR